MLRKNFIIKINMKGGEKMSDISTTDTSKALIRLTNREKEIMDILWSSTKSLVASDIAKQGENMSLNTVQAILRKLLQHKLIKVDDIVYSGTVLTRAYVAAISKESFEIQRLLSEQKNLSASRFVATFLENEADPQKKLEEINNIEELLRTKKKELLGE